MKETITKQVEAVKTAAAGTDAGAIKTAMDALSAEIQKIASQYKAETPPPPAEENKPPEAEQK